MKTLTFILITFFVSGSIQLIYSQTINWNSIEDSKHIVNVGVGWEYGLTYNLGYAYKVKTEIPFLLNANVSMPFGGKIFDDYKTKVGGQIVLLDKPNFKGSIALNGIFRRYENPLVRLQNFGTEIKGTFGYYKPKWFFAGELGFDKAIATHFKHSNSFKEKVYRDVKDGWYEPATGGNFMYGLQTGFSFKKSDVNLNFGMIKTQNFKSTPLIPYYLMLGYNYRIN